MFNCLKKEDSMRRNDKNEPDNVEPEETGNHFESFGSEMALKLKECVRNELAVLLREKEIGENVPEEKPLSEPPGEILGENGEMKDPDFFEEDNEENSFHDLSDEEEDIMETQTIYDTKEEPDYSKKVEIGSIGNLGFETFSGEMAAKLEEIVMQELNELSKQNTITHNTPKHITPYMQEEEEESIFPMTTNEENREMKEPDFFKTRDNGNHDFPTLSDEKEPMPIFLVKTSEETGEAKKPDFPKKEDGETPGLQSFSNEMVVKIEEIVRHELTTFTKQMQQELIPKHQPRSEPTSITFVTINNDNGKSVHSKKVTRRNGGHGARNVERDVVFKAYFVNKLVKKIEQSVKCELIVMSTQKNVIPNILKRLRNIEQEIDGVKEDVMTLYSYTTCVNGADFKLPADGTIQESVATVKTELGKLNSAVDYVFHTVNKLAGEQEKRR